MASSTKQHIVTAQSEGIEAGFDAWYESLVQNTNDGRNGLPQLRALLADVKKVGKKRGRPTNRAKQIEFYCNKYADDLDSQAREDVIVSTREGQTPSTDPIAQLQAQLAGITEALAAVAAGTTTPVTLEVEVEDDEDERPTYSGKDPDAPATSGQLWRLNTLGHFGDVITKAEAFELIADALDEA